MVAQARPLKLKAEIFSPRRKLSSGKLHSATVWVDSGVFHLDSEFEYSVPDELEEIVAIGVRVVVPFGNRECEGIILSYGPVSHAGKLKEITRVVSAIPIATAESLTLIAEVSKRWAAHPYDVIRSAIPPRVASVEKDWKRDDFIATSDSVGVKTKAERTYFQLPPSHDAIELIADYLGKRDFTQGSILVVVPESKLLNRLAAKFPTSLILDSQLAKSDRYHNYLKTLQGGNQLVLGTRSAIFAPLRALAEIVIVHEASENLYEMRTPGWNARDVAMIRSSIFGTSLSFFGYSPSSEAARLIEIGWLKYKAAKGSIRVRDYLGSSGEILPQGIFSPIRSALKAGPVLFISPRKGYSQAVMCMQCKNVALCTCGGKLQQRNVGRAFECVLCQKSYPQWRCFWCQSQKSALLGKGSERFAYEIGRAFPGYQISESSAENIFEQYDKDSGIVIATPGALPVAKNGYAAIVVLECIRLFSQIDMRATERAHEIFFSAAGLLSTEGELFLVISHGHPVLSALAAWKPSLTTRRELREREEVGFPPYVRALTLDIDNSEASSLLRALKTAQESQRLPQSTRILGPSKISSETSRFLLLAPLDEGEALIRLVHEFQRRRSSSKKKLCVLRIDPYSLTS